MSRPQLPPDVALQLRKEAGFGCCFCGYPFIEYHHIVPWAEERHFRPEDMMVLCPNHHSVCTNNGFTIDQQRWAKANPRNIREGLVKGELYVTTTELAVDFGGFIAVDCPILMAFAGEPVLECKLGENGLVLISAKIHDEAGTVVGELIENVWSVDPIGNWDFKAQAQVATARRAAGNIALTVDCRKNQISILGSWHFCKSRIRFSPKSVDAQAANPRGPLKLKMEGCIIKGMRVPLFEVSKEGHVAFRGFG